MQLFTVMNISTVLLSLKLLTIKSQDVAETYVYETINITLLTIEFKDAWLWDYSINEMKPWNPEYNDSASLRYKELSNHMCQLVFNYTDDLVPTGSDEKKCDKVEFSPLKTAGDGDYALKVNATSTISYSYPHIISIDKETLRRNITSAFSHRVKTDVIPKKIPLKITVGEEITTKANPLDHSTTVLPPANTFANTRYNLLFTLQFYLSISLYFACTSLFALPVTVILLTTIVITYLLFNIKRHYLASDL
ncbi:hypothetical protein KSF78_0008971 [Schistosoma japonicum]|nr:hypothetical protein KSF78_0008971 [Schistosoma japonicum]